jgi:hypothetical protein
MLAIPSCISVRRLCVPPHDNSHGFLALLPPLRSASRRRVLVHRLVIGTTGGGP